MALEQEIKLQIVGEATIDLASINIEGFEQSEIVSRHFISHYVDTPQQTLIKNGLGLRLRHDGEYWYQTVKETGRAEQGLHQRQEWEYKLSSNQFDLGLLAETPMQKYLEDQAFWPQVSPLFTTDFIRQAIQLQNGSTHIELVYDRGRVYTEDKQQAIHEIELELISAQLDELKQVAKQLMMLWPVQPSDISKAQMGYQLLTQ